MKVVDNAVGFRQFDVVDPLVSDSRIFAARSGRLVVRSGLRTARAGGGRGGRHRNSLVVVLFWGRLQIDAVLSGVDEGWRSELGVVYWFDQKEIETLPGQILRTVQFIGNQP